VNDLPQLLTDVIREVEYTYGDRRCIKCILVNRIDLMDFFVEAYPDRCRSELEMGAEQSYMYGVKIVASDHVERGSVYKLFENDQIPIMTQPYAPNMTPQPPQTEPARSTPNNNDQEPPRKVQL